MDAAAVAASVAAEAAKEAALAASVAAVAAAKDAAVAAATAKEEAAAASAAALKAEEAAATASVAALNAKEAADVAVTAGQVAATAASAAAAAIQASKKRKFAAVAINAVETAPPVAATAGEAAATAAAAMQASNKRKFVAVALNAVETAPVAATAGEAAATTSVVAEAAAKDAETAKEAVAAASASALYAKQAESVVATAGEAAAVAAVAVAMRASKKLKIHLVDDDQGPPGSEDVDIISRLPDFVLGSIISLLPTKEGVRTQAVSRRWSPLWRSAPLNLVADSKIRSKDHTAIDLITKMLSQHPGPARRFSLNLVTRVCSDKIQGWLSSQAMDNLQELELTYHPFFSPREKDLLPSSAFRFAPTLRVAKFSGLRFPDLIMQLCLEFPCLKQLTLDGVTISEDALHSMLSRCAALESLELENSQGTFISSQTLKFPCLKQLTLARVTISKDTVHSIFSGCPALESLVLKENFGIGRLCISSQNLKCLGFSVGLRWWKGVVLLQELVIEDAPCLERLLPLDSKNTPVTVRIISAPKLKILGMLSEDIAELQVGTTVFQKMIAVSLTTKMHTMRVLLLGSAGPNLHTVVNFLKCFPCLERLHVIFQSMMGLDNVRKYDQLDPIECLELHLKEVVLKNYDGTKRPYIDFAKFFVLNAKVLKKMKIRLPYHCQHKWFAEQHKMLRIKDRASRDARIELKCRTDDYFTYNKHIHDLSTADPFDMPPGRCSQCCCRPF